MGKSAKKTGLIFIIVGVIFALLAVGMTYMTINKVTKKVPMLVANSKIVAGDPIQEDDFRVINIAISARPKDAILPTDDLTGLVALKDMNENDILRYINVVDFQERELPILSTRLRAVSNNLEDGDHIEDIDNLRAGEIPIDSIVGMIDGMKEGDKIAVTSVFIEENDLQEKIRRTETIFDYIHVLGIKKPTENSKGGLVIALTQRQFEALALAREKGKFYIALMPFGVEKPVGHPEILSDLYVGMLNNPESSAVVDFSNDFFNFNEASN